MVTISCLGYTSSTSELFTDCLQVLWRLTEIEPAVGILDSLSIRRMVIGAQDNIVQSQKESVETIRLRDSLPAASEGYFSVGRKIG
jgi:hypothetical protein